ncbi:MAG TPA: glycosyltransferase family A protein [Acidimicrobiia bacterium]|nr:glycosyltransferase family A protein [Acidimicrobiia bacterium]
MNDIFDDAGGRGVEAGRRRPPTVSVVVAVYNGGRYLAATLESVLAQTYRDYEVIVVDDGSTDDSREQARAFGDRVTLVERPHEGLGAARNAGLARATGEYVAFLDADDLWDPDLLRHQVGIARRHPASGLVVCDGIEFEDDRVLRTSLLDPAVTERLDRAADGTWTASVYADFCAGNLVACPAQVLVARHAIERVGAVSLTPNGPQDYDYYVRVSRVAPVTFHGASLVRWRYHGDSTSGPAPHRGYWWSLWALPTLEREQTACAPGDRAMLRAAIRGRARVALAEAVHVRITGGKLERADLASIYRLAPRTPAVLAIRAALALPTPTSRTLLRCARALRQGGRRMVGAPLPGRRVPVPAPAPAPQPRPDGAFRDELGSAARTPASV